MRLLVWLVRLVRLVRLLARLARLAWLARQAWFSAGRRPRRRVRG